MKYETQILKSFLCNLLFYLSKDMGIEIRSRLNVKIRKKLGKEENPPLSLLEIINIFIYI